VISINNLPIGAIQNLEETMELVNRERQFTIKIRRYLVGDFL